ncbi:MAG TPA: hypothetical protein VJR89_11730, partial [Polyangiales bacterium]|nr:hypothetical protein [Polyangiales bacterium]
MSEIERLAQRVVERLSGNQSQLRGELAQLIVDQLFASRARDVMRVNESRELLHALLQPESLRHALERYVVPGYARHVRDVRAHEVRVSALVGPVAHQKLHVAVRALRVPEARWAEHAFDPALVRRLLGPVWTQVLVGFAKRLPLPGLANAAGSRSAPQGLTGFLTRSVQEQAEKLIDRGRSAIGGLGAEVERRLQTAARDFSDGAAHAFRSALHERLHSDEGRELLGQLLSGLVDHVLRTELAALQLDVDVLPMAELLDLAPDVIAHAAASPFVAERVRGELEAWLVASGEQSLAELCAEHAALEPARALLLAHVETALEGVVGAPAFLDWVRRLL